MRSFLIPVSLNIVLVFILPYIILHTETKNQYEMSEYIKKYSECEPDIPVDLHTKSNELHYKIWCIENGRYTREVWYNLMTASLNEKYRTLLDEILA